jgi:hypothetical protein
VGGVSCLQAEKIATIVKAANIKLESYWPALFAKLLEKRSVEDLILSVGSGMHPVLLSRYFRVFICPWMVVILVDLPYSVMSLVLFTILILNVFKYFSYYPTL